MTVHMSWWTAPGADTMTRHGGSRAGQTFLQHLADHHGLPGWAASIRDADLIQAHDRDHGDVTAAHLQNLPHCSPAGGSRPAPADARAPGTPCRPTA